MDSQESIMFPIFLRFSSLLLRVCSFFIMLLDRSLSKKRKKFKDCDIAQLWSIFQCQCTYSQYLDNRSEGKS